MYDQQIGRWQRMDGKAELYFATSPYVFALNQPTNDVDPDGNIVIFINGMHGGSGGTAGYWNAPNYYKTWVRPGATAPSGYHYIGENSVNGGSYYGMDRSFDGEVMNQLNDHNALYRDGAMGGIASIAGFPNNPLSASDRYDAGRRKGAEDAQTLIDNLGRECMAAGI